MKRVLLGSFIAAALLSQAALANTTITVGDHTLDPNKAGQHVQLFAHGNDHVGGIDLYTQIDGAPNKGKDVAGPKITDLDILTGTIFANNNTGVGTEGSDFFTRPSLAIKSTT